MIGYAVTDPVAPATTVRPVPMDPGMQKKLTHVSRTTVRNLEERNRLIVTAYQNGASMREIARATNLTHPGVRAILIRYGVHDPSRD